MRIKNAFIIAAVFTPVLFFAARHETTLRSPTDLRDAVRDPSVKAVDSLITSAGAGVNLEGAVPVPAKPGNKKQPSQAYTPSYTSDSDVPANIRTQMSNDLAFIQSIKGVDASRLHRKVFGEVSGPDYINFFESRVLSVGMDRCESPVAVACVNFNQPTKMWLGKPFLNFSHPQIARVMVVFHEARHTEIKNGNWLHAMCPDPFLDENGQDMTSMWTGALLAGPPAGCDRTPIGSYGSSAIMLKNIQKFCSNCTGKVRMDAGIYSDDQVKRIIDPAAKEEIRKDLYQ